MDALNARLPISDLSPSDLILMVRDSGLELQTTYRERRPPVVAPGQTEAFDLGPIRCVRCGRELKHPHYLNGAPFGRDCYVKEGM